MDDCNYLPAYSEIFLKSIPARKDLDIKRRGCKENFAAPWNIETL